MPRINIEFEVFTSQRFSRLMLLLGSRQKAIGALVDLWTTAQRHWLPNKLPISETEFSFIENKEALIEAQFVEKREDGFYAKGSEKHFKWWFELHEVRKTSGQIGGRISAQRPRDEKGRLLSKQDPSKIQANPSKPKLSSSSSSSSSISKDIGMLTALRAINDALGREFRPVTANLKYIASAIAGGSTVQDLVDVAKLKREQWGDNDKMRKFLRPKTLFNATNLESYRAELTDAKIQSEKYNEFL